MRSSDTQLNAPPAARHATTADAGGFWAGSIAGAMRSPLAKLAIGWLTLVALAAVMAPLIASGHPLLLRASATPGTASSGVATARLTSPLLAHLETVDWLVLLWSAGAAAVAIISLARGAHSRRWRTALLVAVAGISAGAPAWGWRTPPAVFDYAQRESAGGERALYTLIPWSPDQRPTDRDARLLPPGSTHDQPLARSLVSGISLSGPLSAAEASLVRERAAALSLNPETRDALALALEGALSDPAGVTRARVMNAAWSALEGSGRAHALGTDALGQDVLSQMLHACRLALAMGLVATGIAVAIGVTLGALMGYFGGAIDLVLSRVTEVFAGVPVLFVLVLAAGVLPRNTLVMMAIIGCFTWTGAARFTRAEFLRLRSQDFVHAARAAGLPLRSILFRHMLPNGVTAVLVDASFSIAMAIILESTLSFLGLGPTGQASWGRLLADASAATGELAWSLALFPGAAIFFTALSCNLLGEALRDAMDPGRTIAS